MISLEVAKQLLAYLDELTNEESVALNDFAERYTYPDLYEDMRNDPKYEKLMPKIDLYKGIMKDKILGSRDN